MAVPKRRTSSAKRDRRRAHDALSAPGFGTCSNCGAKTIQHRICASCGYYGGKKIVEVEASEE